MSRPKILNCDNFSDIVSRLKHYKHLDKDNDVAKLLDISTTAFANRKNRNSVPFLEIISLCEHDNISLTWLLTGEGKKNRLLDKPYETEKPLTSMAVQLPDEYQHISPEQKKTIEKFLMLSPENRIKVMSLVMQLDEQERAGEQEAKNVSAA